MQFCPGCGTRLASQPAARTPDAPPEGILPIAGTATCERRHLTVMYCDLVESTPLAEQMDPEDFQEVVHLYQEICERAITSYEGHIARFLGDALLVYFGYPVAHEDDAQRAVRAGLRIIDDLVSLNAGPLTTHGIHLSVRIGIHSGRVVVGSTGDHELREDQAFGHTMNLAARLQGIADPNAVVISAPTLRLVQGIFIVQDMGLCSLKGIADPVQAYRVLQASGVRSRLEQGDASSLTPLVGRQLEIDLLLDRWYRARDGKGQVVMLSGEAGIGKSRLVLALHWQLGQEAHSWIECRGSAYHEHSALYPVIDLLKQGLFYAPGDPPEDRITKLERGLSRMGFSLPESIPLFAALLSIPLPEPYMPLRLSAEAQRRKTMEALARWVFGLAELQPLVLVVEDLHWIDPSTLQVLQLLVEQVWTARVLLVFTFRPSFTPPWAQQVHLTQLVLNPLSSAQVKAMISGMLGGKTLPREVVDQLVMKTDGVPIFVEEFTKMIMESGIVREKEDAYELAGPLPSLTIPTTLQDSLMARLDKLSRVKWVAQLGATLGREFSYELIHALSPFGDSFLQDALRQLADAEILYQRGLPPHSNYTFKHTLIQEAAYHALLRNKRREVHRQTAWVLEERFPEIAANEPELLAHHCEQGGLLLEAIRYWDQAGRRAIAGSAHVEAVSHLKRGLELLLRLPESAERSQQELAFQMALGIGLVAGSGYASDQVQRTFARAHELCGEIGERGQHFSVQFGLYMFHIVRSDERDTCEAVDELLRLAKGSKDPSLLLEAHSAAGVANFFRGELATARQHMTQALSLYDPEKHRSHCFTYGQDPGAVVRSYEALNLWFLGYPDQALASAAKAIALAEEISHPFTLVHVINNVAVLKHCRREMEELLELAHRAVALSTEQSFPLWIGAGICEQGWALVQEGKVAEGIRKIKEGTAISRVTGGRVTLPYRQCTLAEACLRAGMIDEGLAEVEDGLKSAHNTLCHCYLPELYRVKGELLLAASKDDGAEAEACFRRAFDVAREQGAMLLQLRAAVSLGRLFAGSSREEEARTTLGEVYGSFTEGFDVADLRDAKALLEGLR